MKKRTPATLVVKFEAEMAGLRPIDRMRITAWLHDSAKLAFAEEQEKKAAKERA